MSPLQLEYNLVFESMHPGNTGTRRCLASISTKVREGTQFSCPCSLSEARVHRKALTSDVNRQKRDPNFRRLYLRAPTRQNMEGSSRRIFDKGFVWVCFVDSSVMTARTGINVMVCNHLRSSDMILLASDAVGGKQDATCKPQDQSPYMAAGASANWGVTAVS